LLPGPFVNQDNDAEEEEHKKHGGMLKVVQMDGVERPVDDKL
jgi:hypothetical protein